jgi:hypothetical protein
MPLEGNVHTNGACLRHVYRWGGRRRGKYFVSPGEDDSTRSPHAQGLVRVGVSASLTAFSCGLGLSQSPGLQCFQALRARPAPLIESGEQAAYAGSRRSLRPRSYASHSRAANAQFWSRRPRQGWSSKNRFTSSVLVSARNIGLRDAGWSWGRSAFPRPVIPEALGHSLSRCPAGAAGRSAP